MSAIRRTIGYARPWSRLISSVLEKCYQRRYFVGRWMAATRRARPRWQPPYLRRALGTASEEDPHLHILFTCKVCNTRSAKSFSRQAYTEGVVIARCPGCQNLHLLADNLRYFRDRPVNIETLMKENGEDVKVLTDGTLEMVTNPVELLKGQSSGQD